MVVGKAYDFVLWLLPKVEKFSRYVKSEETVFLAARAKTVKAVSGEPASLPDCMPDLRSGLSRVEYKKRPGPVVALCEARPGRIVNESVSLMTI